LDGPDMHSGETITYKVPDRLDKMLPKLEKGEWRGNLMDVLYPITSVRSQDIPPYLTAAELYKEVMDGAWTMWGPDHVTKLEPFTIVDPMQIKGDRVSFANKYFFLILFLLQLSLNYLSILKI